MIVYIYGKCSTCQKALKFLKDNQLKFVPKEITLDPPSVEELQRMLRYLDGNLKKLCNTSGQLYREMQLSAKLNELPLDDVLTLLSQHGMLIKRPFLLTDHLGLTGFNEKEWLNKLLLTRSKQ